MLLTSPSFDPNSDIPDIYTCDGENISPAFSWNDIPQETQSFALTCVDPDAPGGPFIHWLVYGIDRNATAVSEDAIPAQGIEVENDFGRKEYGGPCPPHGERHRYIFTMYALDVKEIEGVTKENCIDLMEAHAIDQADLMGFYSR